MEKIKINNNKTKICLFWEKGICKYMNNYEKCIYSHGTSDLKKRYCIYKNNCFSSKCKFEHEIIDLKIKVDLIDFIKPKKISKIKNKKQLEIKENTKTLKYYERDYNKLLNYIDTFYLNKIENLKNTIIEFKNKKNEIVNNNYSMKNKLTYSEDNLENNKKKKKLIYSIDNKIINKYYTLGKMLIEQNNNLNITYINKYFNCKNTSMIKDRCNRIYKLISHMKEYNFKNINISLRSIFHMNKNNFINNLKNNVFIME